MNISPLSMAKKYSPPADAESRANVIAYYDRVSGGWLLKGCQTTYLVNSDAEFRQMKTKKEDRETGEDRKGK